ncbi:brca1 c terminus domain-containing protein [Cystoisospora suis]|uniref:Pescadillo homolog n=1 Tax=Cystoisospora suis TaxID=483139 RepID=A0A2C6KGK8_9APIC|nr:brca1 c terminus domain-containing protein [Cystoisospora suis]
MGRKVKAGTRGEAAQYMTRGQALKKLQLSLAAFRRLCILKGIYPRDPKKKKKGKDKIYYHSKDVLHIAHEPLLDVLRQQKAITKKVRKAVGRKEKRLAKRFLRSRPKVRLHHIVRERFPTLSDAVADLDDALSTACIFAMLPADGRRGVRAEQCVKATQLLDEFLLVVTQQRALRRVFASVKGYYFQVQLLGHLVTFLMPHPFKQEMPEEVDFRVLSTFFELYSATLQLVVFKLFLLAGLAYPPTATRKEAGQRERQAAKSEAAMIAASAARDIPRAISIFSQGPWTVSGWRYPVLRARSISDSSAEKETSAEDEAARAGVDSAGGEDTRRGNGETELDVDETPGDLDEELKAEEKNEGKVHGQRGVRRSVERGQGEGSDGDSSDISGDGSDDESGSDEEDGEVESDTAKEKKTGEFRSLGAIENGGAVEKKSNEHETSSACGVQPHPVQRLFQGAVVFLNREVPLLPFSFMVRSCGGQVGWQGADSPFSERDPSITHHIVDRPPESAGVHAVRRCAVSARPAGFARKAGETGWQICEEGGIVRSCDFACHTLLIDGGAFIPSQSHNDGVPAGFRQVEGSKRDYVQPQWILDSINTALRLPIHPYAPGKQLPPHLSPFVDDSKEGYVPKQREVLDRLVAEKKGVTASGLSSRAVGRQGEDSDGDDVLEDEEATSEGRAFQAELESEALKGLHEDANVEAASEGRALETEALRGLREDEIVEGAGKVAEQQGGVSRETSIKSFASGEGGARSRSAGKLSKKALKEKEELEAKKAVMSKKHKRLLERIDFGVKRRQNASAKLLAKRRALEENSLSV